LIAWQSRPAISLKNTSAKTKYCSYLLKRIQEIVLPNFPSNSMKIIIYNDELRSEMQMYLALSHRYEVEIAQDPEDLLRLLAENAADFTFIDLGAQSGELARKKGFELIDRILKHHPAIKVVGICDREDELLQQAAAHQGIPQVITRPIRNRELFKMIENSD
jgi:PleD family two-component response regulator